MRRFVFLFFLKGKVFNVGFCVVLDVGVKSLDYAVHKEFLQCVIFSLQQQGGYIAIQISSQTTKKDVSENPPLRTISFCDTITFAPVQSQVLRNSRN
jgi:hypothetical protein